jgi:glycosyltransferase involved in cell wall biosynthesis
MQGLAVPAPMAVMFISSAEHPGADTLVHTLIMRNLDRARFHVHAAASPGDPADGSADGFRLLAGIPHVQLRSANFGPSLSGRTALGKLQQLMTGGTAMAASLLSLANYIRRHRISVLHATDRPRDAAACAILGKLTGAKSIIHAHLKCDDWMSDALRRSMHHVDALIAISDFVAGSLADRGYAREKTYTVLNGIDLARWDFRLTGLPIRQEFGIPATAPVIACAGRLFEGKGQGHLVRAVAALRPEFPDIRLLVIGKDDRQVMQESFTEQLKALAATLGVGDNVVFAGQRADMPALLAASDVFALPSEEEPFGLVFAEAMAMKRPVIALANGGTPEVVEHGRDGLLSGPNDLEALTANLRTLLREPTLRRRMGEHGRQRVEARFTAQRMALETGRVYVSLAQPPKSKVVALGEQVTR